MMRACPCHFPVMVDVATRSAAAVVEISNSRDTRMPRLGSRESSLLLCQGVGQSWGLTKVPCLPVGQSAPSAIHCRSTVSSFAQSLSGVGGMNTG